MRAAIELLHGILIIIAAWKTASIVDMVFMHGCGLRETASEILMLFLCIFAMALLRLPKSRIESQLSDDLRLYCRRALHRELLAHGQNGAGVLTLTLERVDALDPWFRTLLPTMIAGVVIIPLVLLVTAVVDPLSALLFLVTLPIAPFLLYLIGKATRRASERQWDEMRTLTDGFGDLVRAAATLKIFRRVDAEGHHLAQMSHAFSEASLAVLRLAFVSSFALELITTLSIALIAVSIGLRLMDGGMTFHAAFFVLILAPQFYQPLREGGIAFHAAMDAATAEKALAPYLDAPPSITGTHDQILSPPSVRTEALTYRYPLTDEAVLTDLTLSFPAGKSTVIAGDSGSGKSTLFMILAGLYTPQAGEILADGAALKPSDLRAYSNNISAVFSDFYLFDYATGDADIAHEWLALTHLQDKVELKGAKFSTTSLSSGQRKRLALVSVLMDGRKFLMLDEFAADLDPQFRAEFYERILPELKSRGYTIFAISHDDKYFGAADKIYKMQRGEISRIK